MEICKHLVYYFTISSNRLSSNLSKIADKMGNSSEKLIHKNILTSTEFSVSCQDILFSNSDYLKEAYAPMYNLPSIIYFSDIHQYLWHLLYQLP